jgi:hypothetical protein
MGVEWGRSGETFPWRSWRCSRALVFAYRFLDHRMDRCPRGGLDQTCDAWFGSDSGCACV